MNIALGLGEEYIFLCDSGLINMAHALTDKSSVIGYMVVGPIPMGTSREKAIRHFCDKILSDNVDLPLWMGIMSELRMYTPAEITHLMKLFSNIFKSLDPDDSLNAVNRQKSKEQSNVVSKIIEMKRSNIELAYPVASENELLHSISNGDLSASVRNLSKYVEDLMVFENGDLSIIKLRLLSLFGQLTRKSAGGTSGVSGVVDRKFAVLRIRNPFSTGISQRCRHTQGTNECSRRICFIHVRNHFLGYVFRRFRNCGEGACTDSQRIFRSSVTVNHC